MSEPAAPPAWRAADPELLRDAVERAGGGGEPPGPSLAEYAFDLGRWLQSLFVAALGRALPDAGLETLERIVVWAAAGVALAALVAALVLAARRARRRRPRADAAIAETHAAASIPATARDAAWWWDEAARRLERGEGRAALGALWWWAARRLDPPGLDESWTTAELARASGAAALRPTLRRLDALLWGAAPPRAEEVAALRGELRRGIEGAGGAPA